VGAPAQPPTRKQLNKSIGARGEAAAERELRRLGYRILERNYRCKAGEIDIIAEHQGHVVFVEVKTRSPRSYLPPEAAVDDEKQARVRKTAKFYLSPYRQPSPARFDVVCVDLDASDAVAQIRVQSNAFAP
jgi:putative endonuclease